MKRFLNVLLISLFTLSLSCSFLSDTSDSKNKLTGKDTGKKVTSETSSSKKTELPPLKIENGSVEVNVLSKNKVLVKWSTNRFAKGRLDLNLLKEDNDEIESTQEGISEYPEIRKYKQHKLLLENNEDLELLPGRQYSFTVYAWVEDSDSSDDIDDSQEVRASGPRFTTKEELDLAIFVQNSNNEILTFPFPNDNTNLNPTYKISNPQKHTLVNTAYDSSNDILYFTLKDINGVLVFSNLKDPNMPSETRIIEGGNTMISNPSALFLDEKNDTLYVANKGNNSVVVFRQASLIAGDTKPNRVLKGVRTWIKSPTGMTLDVERDVLYVSCATRTGDTVLSFYPASEVDGNTPAVAKLYGTGTKIKKPVALTFDQVKKQLYILNSTKEVLVFNDQAGKEYNPKSSKRLLGQKTPNRVISNLNWEMTFSPFNYGGIAFDANSDRLFVSGKTEGHSRSVVNVFNGASALNGEVQATLGINASEDIVSAMGIALEANGQSLFAVTHNDSNESVVAYYDLTEIATGTVTEVATQTQVSAFGSTVTGLNYSNIDKSLFVLTGDYLSFDAETIQNSWNYFNADQVFKKPANKDEEENTSENNFSDFSKVIVDASKSIMYSMDKTNNSIVAFDGMNSSADLVIEVLPSRKIFPNIYNYHVVDFALNKTTDTMYLLMTPQSGTNRNLSVFVIENASQKDGDVLASNTLVVTTIPDNVYENKGLCIEVDSRNDRLFVSVPRKIEIFDSVTTIVGGQTQVEPSKVISKTESNLGTAMALYFYQPEDAGHTSYLLIANSRDSGVGSNNIIGFDNTALDSKTSTVTPIFQLASPNMYRPLSLSVGNLK